MNQAQTDLAEDKAIAISRLIQQGYIVSCRDPVTGDLGYSFTEKGKTTKHLDRLRERLGVSDDI